LFAQIEEALVELGVPAGHAPVMASRITLGSQIRSLIAIVENGVVCPGGARARRVAGDLEPGRP